MENRKRKAIGSVLDGRHLQRLPKVRDKLSSLVRTGSRTASGLSYEQTYPAIEDKRQSRLDFTGKDLGGPGLDIDLRSLEAFRNADESWFGHGTAARGGRQEQPDDKSSTPIADLFSKSKGNASRPTSLVVDKPLPPPPAAPPPAPAASTFQDTPSGGAGRQHYVVSKSDNVAAVEDRSDVARGRPVSVIERRRGVRPSASRERRDLNVEPIRIKLATTSEPAEPKKPPPPLEPTWKSHIRRTSQKANKLSHENGSTSDHGATTTTPRSPRLSGVSVKTHIRRCSQNLDQLADGPDSPTKRQSMPASMPGSYADRSTLVEIKNSLHGISKTPASPGQPRLVAPSTVGRPSELRRQSWSTTPPTNVSTSSSASSTIAPALGVRRNASTRAPGGVNRLAWIKELEEGRHSKPGLSRELPVLRKVQGSVADKLARFESLGQQPDVAVPQVPRTRSNSITSQRSFLTSSGSRPGSWYQGSTIATTARTSIDSHRPPSVLLNYDESFREKMQVVAGKYDKRDAGQESEADRTDKKQTGPSDPKDGKVSQNVDQSDKADAVTFDAARETEMSEKAEPIDKSKQAETSKEVEKTKPVETPASSERAELDEEAGTVVEPESAEKGDAVEKAEPVEKTDPVEDTGSVETLGPADKPEPAEMPEPAKKTEPAGTTESVEDTESDDKAETIERVLTNEIKSPVQEANTVAGGEANILERRDPVEEAEPVERKCTVEKAKPVEGAGTVAREEAGPLGKQEPVEKAPSGKQI